MRKLATAAALVALTTATPAFADGNGKGGDSFNQHLKQAISGAWQSAVSTPPGFSSPGRHSGWANGKHWGWFKPKNPHWPHDPVSP
jgi:hypothetical protein